MTDRFCFLLLTAGLVVACARGEKKDDAAPLADQSTASAASSSQPELPIAKPMTTGEPDTQIPEGDIPTEENFEQEAATKLTSANLEVELDALEAEIGK